MCVFSQPVNGSDLPFTRLTRIANLTFTSFEKIHIIFPVMDWQGQKLAEQLMQILLLIAAVVAFVVGYTTASFRTMMLIYAGGVGITTLITVPNWPFFNRHSLKWLDPSEAEKHPKPEVAVSSKKKSSKK
ncbi:hypothetical protein F2Q70_00033736 [Brassica cretica]|uniref:Signal peptidase complex subunit 1 n=1 Tax=Brassica cretica TaxID=69181 RepID=A0A8S9JX70_BRACR|nr:hypothetical protein F2Q68_00028610 [Brassica cretica]KAF2586227.1 hypothetical protein F2Q70_00033736 [Brassica cretica]